MQNRYSTSLLGIIIIIGLVWLEIAKIEDHVHMSNTWTTAAGWFFIVVGVLAFVINVTLEHTAAKK